MLRTVDLVLLYYDKPEILKNWFVRLVQYSDILRFLDRMNIIIADSGSPLDKVEASLAIVREQPTEIQRKVIYARAETTEIRKRVPEGVEARPQSHTYNMAVMDISKADVVIGSVLGHIFTPRYFNGHFAEHLKDDRAIVLPRRFDLDCLDYHTNWFNVPWERIRQFPFLPSGGWPDFSVRREWFLEIGGWDEYYTFIAPADMDFGSRLCGKLDNGMPSQFLFTFKDEFRNLGLHFSQPFRDDFLSLTCNTFAGHLPKNSPTREKGHQIGTKYYLEHWGEIKRNGERKAIEHRLFSV